MIQYIILGYLIFEILRLSQLPDVAAVKFAPPPSESTPSSSVHTAPVVQITSPESPAPQKSEMNTAKSE